MEYVVRVLSYGGGSSDEIIVEATSPDKAKKMAENIANSDEDSPYEYRAVSVRSN